MLGGVFKLQDLLILMVLMVLLWPGYRDLEPLERPKKGFWTVDSIFWPLRKAYRSVFPAHSALAKPMRNTLTLAGFVVVTADLISTAWPPAAAVMNRGGADAILAVVALLIGRAAGFWSADRRIAKAAQAKQAVGTEVQA